MSSNILLIARWIVGALAMSLAASVAQPASAQEDSSDPFATSPASTSLGDVWIDDLRTFLITDRDRDGWFSRLEVSIDADVRSRTTTDRRPEALVFAVVSLTDSIGIERLLFESAAFVIAGRSNLDQRVLEFDLRDQFPEDRYDLVVELRDAFDDQLLDVVDARDFASARNLPLEDAFRDGRIANDAVVSSFVAVEYSGAAGPALLWLAGLVLLLRRGHRRCSVMDILRARSGRSRLESTETDHGARRASRGTSKRLPGDSR